MNLNDYIPLKEWGERENITPSAVRHKIRRGTLRNVKKISGTWFIHKDEKNIDHRFKKTD